MEFKTWKKVMSLTPKEAKAERRNWCEAADYIYTESILTINEMFERIIWTNCGKAWTPKARECFLKQKEKLYEKHYPLVVDNQFTGASFYGLSVDSIPLKNFYKIHNFADEALDLILKEIEKYF